MRFVGCACGYVPPPVALRMRQLFLASAVDLPDHESGHRDVALDQTTRAGAVLQRARPTPRPPLVPACDRLLSGRVGVGTFQATQMGLHRWPGLGRIELVVDDHPRAAKAFVVPPARPDAPYAHDWPPLPDSDSHPRAVCGRLHRPRNRLQASFRRKASRPNGYTGRECDFLRCSSPCRLGTCTHRLTFAYALIAEPEAFEKRDVPESFTPRQRKEFIEISNRCKVELNATFSAVAIGLQLYLESARLAGTPPNPDNDGGPSTEDASTPLG